MADSTSADLTAEADEIDVNALRSRIEIGIAYHLERRGSLEFRAKLLSLLAVVAGSAAFGLAMGDDPEMRRHVGLAMAIVGGANMVFQPGQFARLHADICKALMNAERGLPERGTVTAETYRRVLDEVRRIEIDEPPPLRGLQAKAHNAYCIAHGAEPDDRIDLGLLQRVLAPFSNAFMGSLRTRAQIAAESGEDRVPVRPPPPATPNPRPAK